MVLLRRPVSGFYQTLIATVKSIAPITVKILGAFVFNKWITPSASKKHAQAAIMRMTAINLDILFSPISDVRLGQVARDTGVMKRTSSLRLLRLSSKLREEWVCKTRVKKIMFSGGRSKNASTAREAAVSRMIGLRPQFCLLARHNGQNITRAKLDIFLKPANFEAWQLSQLLKRQGLRPTSRIIATKPLLIQHFQKFINI